MKIFFCAILFFFSLPVTGAETSLDITEQIENFNIELSKTTATPEQRRYAFIKSRYHKYFPDVPIRLLNDAELKSFYTASLNASSLSRDPGIAKQVRAIFDEMSSRKTLSSADYQYMQGLYVRLRLFDDAELFNEKFKAEAELESIPKINQLQGYKSTARSVFTIENSDEQINRMPFQVADGFFVLVIAHPKCHFTQDAAHAIEMDPYLREFFSTRSEWIMPDDFRFNLPEVRRWNALFPNYELSMVDDVRQWSEVEFWDTPAFYFYKDGEVIDVIRGWPKGGHRDELKVLIAKYRNMGGLE